MKKRLIRWSVQGKGKDTCKTAGHREAPGRSLDGRDSYQPMRKPTLPPALPLLGAMPRPKFTLAFGETR